MTTEQNLADRLEELREKATPGPWPMTDTGDGKRIVIGEGLVEGPNGYEVAEVYSDDCPREVADANAALITELVNNLPAIISALRGRESADEGWRTIDSAPKDGTPVDLWVVHSCMGWVNGRIERNARWKADKVGPSWFGSTGCLLGFEEVEDEDGSLTTSRATHWAPVVTTGPNGERSWSTIARPASAMIKAVKGGEE